MGRFSRRTIAVGVAATTLLLGFVWWRMAHEASSARGRIAQHTPPDSAVYLYQRGLTEQRRRTLEGAVEAMSLFDRAIAADSDFSLAWAAAARTAQFASIRAWAFPGRDADSLLSLAVRASRRAVALDSGSAEAWTVAGKVAGTLDLADRGATLYALRRALALDSTYAEAWFELGLAQEESLHPAEAERAWLHAAALSPTNSQVLAFLGFHYLWYDDYAKGARWADSAVAVDPTYFLARDAAAYLALTAHRPSIAIGHAEAELRTRGHEPPIPFCLLATAAARQGDSTGARRYALHAESLVGNQPPSKHAAVFLAAAWAAVGDTTRAIHWLETYSPRGDLHFQLHVKRDPDLRWVAKLRPSLLVP